MKAKIRTGLLLLVCIATLLTLGSCHKDDKFAGYFDEGYIEDFFYDHSYYDVDKTWRLCAPVWYTSYTDRLGNFYVEEQVFYKERRGRIDYYKNGRPDGYEFFAWHWDDYGQTRIQIDYGDRYMMLYDVRIGNYEFSYIMDDGYVIYYQAL